MDGWIVQKFGGGISDVFKRGTNVKVETLRLKAYERFE